MEWGYVMGKIAFLVPTEDMIQQAKTIVKDKKNTDFEMKVVTSENVLEEAELSVQNGANVVIARGNQAAKIKRNTTIPLVEIKLTGLEIARLIYEAKDFEKE